MKRLAFLSVLLVLGLAPQANAFTVEVGDGDFNTTSFTGTAGGVGITGTVGGSNLQFVPNRFITNNTYQLFDNPAFTAADSGSLADVDRIATFFTGGTVGTQDTISFTFSEAVTDPIIHLMNVDHTSWNLQTPGATLTLLSQNGGLDGDLIASGTIQDNTLNTATGPADSVASISGSGSIRINGTFTQLDFIQRRETARPGTQIDGQQIQFHIPEPPPVSLDI